jgi:hypothetical protein
MHWWADGGFEGYMVPAPRPANRQAGLPEANTCLVENTDTLFATDSHHLTAMAAPGWKVLPAGRRFGYAIYGHTDSRASHAYNQSLSERRARAVAQVARSVGASVERELVSANPAASPATDGCRHAAEPSRRSHLLPVVIPMKILYARTFLVLPVALTLAGCVEGTRPYVQSPDTVIATAFDRGRDTGLLTEGRAAIAYDPDGCQNWIIDDGVEGYSSPASTRCRACRSATTTSRRER